MYSAEAEHREAGKTVLKKEGHSDVKKSEIKSCFSPPLHPFCFMGINYLELEIAAVPAWGQENMEETLQEFLFIPTLLGCLAYSVFFFNSIFYSTSGKRKLSATLGF